MSPWLRSIAPGLGGCRWPQQEEAAPHHQDHHVPLGPPAPCPSKAAQEEPPDQQPAQAAPWEEAAERWRCPCTPKDPEGTRRGPRIPHPPGVVEGTALSLASLLQVSKPRRCITTGGAGPGERSPCPHAWSTPGRCHPPQPCSPKAAEGSPAIKCCVSSCTAASVLPAAAGPSALTPGPSQTPSTWGHLPLSPVQPPAPSPSVGELTVSTVGGFGGGPLAARDAHRLHTGAGILGTGGSWAGSCRCPQCVGVTWRWGTQDTDTWHAHSSVPRGGCPWPCSDTSSSCTHREWDRDSVGTGI